MFALFSLRAPHARKWAIGYLPPVPCCVTTFRLTEPLAEFIQRTLCACGVMTTAVPVALLHGVAGTYVRSSVRMQSQQHPALDSFHALRVRGHAARNTLAGKQIEQKKKNLKKENESQAEGGEY